MLVPLPFEAKLSLPGLRRACSMSPGTPLTGVFAETTSTLAPLPTSATGARSFFVSKGSDLYSDTLIALGGAATSSVCPSGALFATKSVPILPPEPVRFSTMTGCPSASPRRGASARAVKSVIPPGGKVTTSRIGFEGYWPGAAVEKRRVTIAAATACIARSRFRRPLAGAADELLLCHGRDLQAPLAALHGYGIERPAGDELPDELAAPRVAHGSHYRRKAIDTNGARCSVEHSQGRGAIGTGGLDLELILARHVLRLRHDNRVKAVEDRHRCADRRSLEGAGHRDRGIGGHSQGIETEGCGRGAVRHPNARRQRKNGVVRAR